MKREKVFVLAYDATGIYYITVGQTWQQAGQGGQQAAAGCMVTLHLCSGSRE